MGKQAATMEFDEYVRLSDQVAVFYCLRNFNQQYLQYLQNHIIFNILPLPAACPAIS
jgi:hypothetical protein